MTKKFNLNSSCCIVVHYKSDLKKFTKIIQKLKKNFKYIIIVNNSIDYNLNYLKSSSLIIINNITNIGLASALNQGIKLAKKKKFV